MNQCFLQELSQFFLNLTTPQLVMVKRKERLTEVVRRSGLESNGFLGGQCVVT